MPDEAAPHQHTWMAFGPQTSIWGDLVPEVQQDLARIARTIARYEPVTLLVRPAERALAARLCGPTVELLDAELDDLWIRDTGPTFVRNAQGQLGGLDLNFNGWGEKQRHQKDATVAGRVSAEAGAIALETSLVGEGGGIEVDGEGSAIITESCFLNANRNPGVTKADFEAELKPLLGLKKIIWLPGIEGMDITDGHTDFYARFARPGVVVAALEQDPEMFDYAVTRKHLKILQAATDAQGRSLEVVTLASPERVRPAYAQDEDFAAGYINYYVVNGAVIAPEFGDRAADEACKTTLARLFPGREIVQLNIDAIAAGGGGIHCATQQQPRV